MSEYMYRVLQPMDWAQQITVEDMQGVKLQVCTALRIGTAVVAILHNVLNGRS